MNNDATPSKENSLSPNSPIQTYDDFRAALARPEFFFLNKPITFDDPWIDGTDNTSTLQLLQRIHAAWPKIQERAEREFRQYYGEDPEMLANIEEPTIYVDEEDFLAGGPFTKWTLVITRADWPDYGCHIEFSDSTFLNLWSGD